MTDLDPMNELRQSNPVDDDQLPSASLARIRARIQETVMSENQPEIRGTQSSRGFRVSIALAGATMVTAFALVAFRPAAGAPVASPGGGGGGGTAMCIRFDTATLAASDTAFAGTVSTVDGDQITFDVTTWYTGSGDATVTLTNSGLGDVGTVNPGSEFQVGDQWLISANDGVIAGCGYSLPADDAYAADWLSAF